MPPECLDELQASEKQAIHGLLASEAVGVGTLLEIEKFSNLNRLFDVLTYVLKFCSALRRSVSLLLSTATKGWLQSLS